MAGRVLACAVITALSAAACSNPIDALSSVRITRQSPLLHLPSLIRVETDTATVQRLVRDIESLPTPKPGRYACPGDDGDTYTLTFTNPHGDVRVATVQASGCGFVTGFDGTTLWGAASPLLTDLADVLQSPVQ